MVNRKILSVPFRCRGVQLVTNRALPHFLPMVYLQFPVELLFFHTFKSCTFKNIIHINCGLSKPFKTV